MTLTRIQLEGIVRRHTPRGWHVFERTHDSEWGSTEPKRRRINCLPFFSRRGKPNVQALYIFAHEVGHVRYRHDHYSEVGGRGRAPGHVEEYEAEMYAMALFKHEGIPVPKRQLNRALWNVRSKIKKERAAGKRIDPKVEAWAKR